MVRTEHTPARMRSIHFRLNVIRRTQGDKKGFGRGAEIVG